MKEKKKRICFSPRMISKMGKSFWLTACQDIESHQVQVPDFILQPSMLSLHFAKDGDKNLEVTQIYSILVNFTQIYSKLKFTQIGLGNDCQIRVAQLSPGLVETEFTEVMTKDKTKTEELYKSLECLQSEDMADCIKYILEAHPRMQIHDILVRPTQQKF